MGHDTIVNYSCEAFLAFIRKKFQIVTCILCMRIHVIRIHEYHYRLIRSEVTEKNIQIKIFSIYCSYAKAEGRQYTKRILPYFVIPECNICLVNIFAFYKDSQPSGKPDYSKTAGILGTVDERTIKRHYNMVATYIRQTIVEIAHFLSSIPNLTVLPDFKPGHNNEIRNFFQYLSLLNLAMEKAGIQTKTEPVRILHRTYVLHKIRKFCPVIPMNLVECSATPYDTS
ncbi:MAG TPA: hypothetical protein VE912_10055 [Bacteroidales bacterium]|nr:hypothetical protein [Bacteroidales bacterium]